MIRLGVNVDHVATVRQARKAHEPDPAAAAMLAVLGGADGITIHLREDRRHIQDRDLRVLRETVVPPVILNLEMAAVDAVVDLACAARPDQVTLVPERREELTTEGGLDVVTHRAAVARAVDRLRPAGIAVSLFIDPDARQIDVSRSLGVTAVEFQTATYSESKTPEEGVLNLGTLEKATAYAVRAGLHVHMGHGLNYINVRPIVRIPGVEELNIGHSIVSRAILVGMERAVREMRAVMTEHFPLLKKTSTG